MINHLCVIGVGLIGGSFARAVRAEDVCNRITGVGRNLDNLQKAVDLGVIDDFSFDVKNSAQHADFIMISTPVGSYKEILSELKDVWSDKAVYTDAGSTKQSVADSLIDIFGKIPENFVPGHPIAGAENSGVLASRDDLFKDKQVILTPLKNTRKSALDLVRAVWQAIGSSVSDMELSHHDKVLAETSHLPHILAYTLVDLLNQKDEKREVFKYAAGGFKDFTRIASSDPRMWVDICDANRNEIISLIDQFSLELTKVSNLLHEKKTGELLTMFKRARQARERFLEQSEKN